METLLLVLLCWQMPAPTSADPAPGTPSSYMRKPRQDEPVEKPVLQKPATKVPDSPEPRFAAGLDFTYDSNIIKLDDRDVQRLEDGTRPDKFRIEQPDDFIFNPWAEAGLRMGLFGEPVTIGVRGEVYQYVTNTIANYESIGAFVRHSVVDIEYSYKPEVYKREYNDPFTDTFQSGIYAEHLTEVSVKLVPFEPFTIRPQVGLEYRDMEDPFNYRDAITYWAGARAILDLTEWLEIFFGYQFELRDAYEEPGLPDISYEQHSFEPGLAVKFSKEFEISARYRYADREYTTDNPPDVDPGHTGRTDDRNRLIFRTAWKATKSLELEGEYRRSWVDSNLPNDPGATDEETSWDRDEYTVALSYKF